MTFKNRVEAGRQLSEALREYAGPEVVVYALPRGGVAVGLEVAKRIKAPLDLVITRKIGHPYSPEYAIAAVAENGDIAGNEEEIAYVNKNWFDLEVKNQQIEAKRRREAYLGPAPSPPVKGKTAIIVDDGLATGLTMKVAVKELRHRQPERIVVAVPVAPRETLAEISKLVDRVVCLYAPKGSFGAIGQYYEDFSQVTDEEVVALMRSAKVP